MRPGGGGNQTLLTGKSLDFNAHSGTRDKASVHVGQQFRTSTHETCATEMKGLLYSTHWPRDMIMNLVSAESLITNNNNKLSENSKPIFCLKGIWNTNYLTHLLWKIPKQ